MSQYYYPSPCGCNHPAPVNAMPAPTNFGNVPVIADAGVVIEKLFDVNGQPYLLAKVSP